METKKKIVKPPRRKKVDDENLTDKIFEGEKLPDFYQQIEGVVIKTFGDSLRNLCPRRRKKLIQRGVLLWMKGNNAVIFHALKAIHFPKSENKVDKDS